MSQIDRNQAYTMALAAAKSEYDEIIVDWQKLVARVTALRHTMKGLAYLLNDELDEKYQFISPAANNPSHYTNAGRREVKKK